MKHTRAIVIKKLYFVLIVFFCLIFRNNVYAGNAEDTVFLCVGEKYVIEQQADNLSTCTSENEDIASMEKRIITGKAPGETYVVIHNADNTEKRLHVFVGDYATFLLHDYILTKIEEATCSENGYAEYVCQNCQHNDTQLLPAGHIYESKTIKPTCTNQGYTLYTCNKCGHSYKDSYINASGHHYAITSYINYNSIIQKKCTICKNITYEMNIK